MTDTQKAITLIWSIVGVATLYISANIYFDIHGSEFFLPSIKLEKTDHYSAAFYGVFFTVPLILTTHYLTRIYANYYSKGPWYKNLPVAFNLDLSELDGFLRNYQRSFFIFVILIPSLLHIDFIVKFFHGTVYIQNTCQPVLVAWQQFTFDLSIYDYGVNSFRFGDCKIGIDYIPIVFPLAIVAVEIVHAWSLVTTVRRVGVLHVTHSTKNITSS